MSCDAAVTVTSQRAASLVPVAATSLTASIETADVRLRIAERLRGTAPKATNVVWQRDGRRVLLQTANVTARTVAGWLVCNVPAQTDETGLVTVQLVFHLGARSDGDGPRAAAVVNVPDPKAAIVADAWGADLQRVVWDAVLDVVETSVEQAAAQHPGKALLVGGFHCDAGRIHVDIQAGG